MYGPHEMEVAGLMLYRPLPYLARPAAESGIEYSMALGMKATGPSVVTTNVYLFLPTPTPIELTGALPATASV